MSNFLAVHSRLRTICEDTINNILTNPAEAVEKTSFIVESSSANTQEPVPTLVAYPHQ